MDNDNIVNITDLVFEYTDDNKKDKTRVLNGVNLRIRRGEFLAVLGRNGSGKSTLAKHMNGILIPTEGKVEVDGTDTSDESRLFEVRRRVGMVFQNPDNEMVATIVEEDVAFAPENLGVPSKEIRKRVDDALEIVGMSDFKEHAPHMLSGGQKQRVAIAGALAMKPMLLVMDEPTAMLDPIGRKEVIETAKKLVRDEGMTVVLITHYMDEASEADRVVVLDKGKIALEGKPREIFSQGEKLRALGLEAPQSTYLIHMLKQEVPDLDETVLNDEECAAELLRAIRAKRRRSDD